MKKLLFIIILNAFLFSSGSVYLSVDVQNDFGYHSDFLDADFDNSFENGSIVLGYSKTVYQKDQFLLSQAHIQSTYQASYRECIKHPQVFPTEN